MNRWLALLIIGAVVVSGIQGCVLVVADEDIAHEIRDERNRSRLARDIQKSIDQEPRLGYSNIDVSEDGGEVTLAGDADSIAALEHAVDIARSYPKVRSLNLRVRVEPVE